MCDPCVVVYNIYNLTVTWVDEFGSTYTTGFLFSGSLEEGAQVEWLILVVVAACISVGIFAIFSDKRLREKILRGALDFLIRVLANDPA